jgi:hypothetical protein
MLDSPHESNRAKLFQNGGSQAVRLPKECRFASQTEVVVRREGRRVIRLMPEYLLDTDTVSVALRGQGRVAARLLEHHPSQLCIGSITLAELRFGAETRAHGDSTVSSARSPNLSRPAPSINGQRITSARW